MVERLTAMIQDSKGAPRTTPPIMRMDALTNYVQLARSTIYALVAAEKFPAPRQYVGTTRVWLTADVDAWMASTLAAANNDPKAA